MDEIGAIWKSKNEKRKQHQESKVLQAEGGIFFEGMPRNDKKALSAMEQAALKTAAAKRCAREVRGT
jgi:hypothetical protein